MNIPAHDGLGFTCKAVARNQAFRDVVIQQKGQQWTSLLLGGMAVHCFQAVSV